MDKVKEKKTKNKIGKGKQHCRRCGKNEVKLYPWRGFHFCLTCQKELNSIKK